VTLPKISIITACFNSEDFISTAIESVNKQTYPNIEHVFVDGQSTDGTVTLIKRLSQRSPVVVSEIDSGIYDALNKGMALSSGDIIGFVHSDDFLMDEFSIEKVASRYINNMALDVTYSDLVYVSKSTSNKVVRLWKAGSFSKYKIKYGWMPPHPTLFVRKTRYDDIGFFDLSYQISSDYDSIVRLFYCNDLVVEYIPEILVNMRVGGESNRSLERIIQKSTEDVRIMKKYGLPFVLCLILKNLTKISQFFMRKKPRLIN
jgi:glycosyltransferase